MDRSHDKTSHRSCRFRSAANRANSREPTGGVGNERDRTDPKNRSRAPGDIVMLIYFSEVGDLAIYVLKASQQAWTVCTWPIAPAQTHSQSWRIVPVEWPWLPS